MLGNFQQILRNLKKCSCFQNYFVFNFFCWNSINVSVSRKYWVIFKNVHVFKKIHVFKKHSELSKMFVFSKNIRFHKKIVCILKIPEIEKMTKRLVAIVNVLLQCEFTIVLFVVAIVASRAGPTTGVQCVWVTFWRTERPIGAPFPLSLRVIVYFRHN